MLLLTETQIDRLVRYRRIALVGGLMLIVTAIALPHGWGVGGLTGFMLTSLGVYSFAFRNWRTEPGIWMLAGFLTVLLAPCWLYFEYQQFQRQFAPAVANNQVWNALRLSLDTFFSLLIFGQIVGLSISVAFQNWRRTRNVI